MARKRLPMVGQTFGLLTVTAPDKKNNSGHWYYKCACVCGNTYSARGVKLRNGRTKSCGCYIIQLQESQKTINFLEGQTFGRLTILRRLPNPPKSGQKYECRCSCGVVTQVFKSNLMQGNSKSCGCGSKRGRRFYE